MKKIVSGNEMKALDAFTINEMKVSSLVLMERAALAVVDELLSGAYDVKKILIVCGSGNNGGDGVAAARILHLKGYDVSLWEAGNPEKYSEGMKAQREIAGNYQLKFVTNPECSEYTVIVDAVFGVGLAREITGRYQEIIEKINRSGRPVIAVDIPSGIHSDTGNVMGCAVRAAATVTFAYTKAGILLGMGQTYSGKVVTADIGIYEPKSQGRLSVPLLCEMESSDLNRLPKRREDGNKGTFGKVLLIAGSKNMAGAAFLAGMASLRSGCGMLKIYTAEENRNFLLSSLPEAMLSVYGEEPDIEQLAKDMQWADVIGVGPGLSMNPPANEILQYVLKEKGTKPCVLDADALNLLSLHMSLLEEAAFPCILTPHLGEFSRLSGQSITEIRRDPVESVRTFSNRYGVTCVCKDARTLTVMPDGTGYINTSGCSALATAGSGDVLTGLLLGILAQTPGHCEIEVIPMTVYLHGLLGTRAAARLSKGGVTARDLIEELIKIEKELERQD